MVDQNIVTKNLFEFLVQFILFGCSLQVYIGFYQMYPGKFKNLVQQSLLWLIVEIRIARRAWDK